MTTLMRTKDTNKVKESTKTNYLATTTDRTKVAMYDNCYATGYFIKDTVDSEDLTLNISGVVEQQNKTLHQIETNLVKKYLEMLEETDEKKEDHKTFYEQIVEYMRFGIHENSVFASMAQVHRQGDVNNQG